MAETTPGHPRKEPEVPGPLTEEALRAAFGGSADLLCRPVQAAGERGVLLAVDGLVRTERVNDYILRPLSQLPGDLRGGGLLRTLLGGALPLLTLSEIETADEGVFALLEGAAVLLFPRLGRGLRCAVATEEKRAVSDPKDEPDPKGSRDSFVESLRTNTSLVRRRLRCAKLRVEEEIVGRQTRTPVDLIYIEGVALPGAAEKVMTKLRGMDVDGVLAAGNLEQYLWEELDTPFPQTFSTQRPDRFCANLLAGRVGVLVDGIPLGFLLPGGLGLFLAAPEDRTDNWMVAGGLTILRYGALLLTLFLPALYVAAVLFHPEMIPLPLARSIVAAREKVPFGVLFEAVTLLLAFEALQEAGLRLPGTLGQTVGILGGLVVGSAAVEARLISPAALVVVAGAGVAGYTIPSRDFAGGVRLWRLGLTLAAGAGGLLGLTLGGAVLAGHLAGLAPLGVPYLAPLGRRGSRRWVRLPIPRVKYRPGWLKSENRRNQR